MQIIIELAHMISLQLWTIIDNDAIRNSELANDVFPNEFLNTLLSDGCHYFSLDPLSEILTCYDDNFFFFVFWPLRMFWVCRVPIERMTMRWQLLWHLMFHFGKLLTFITPFYIFYDLFLHYRPIVSISKCFMSECPFAQVLFIDFFINLPQCVFGLIRA